MGRAHVGRFRSIGDSNRRKRAWSGGPQQASLPSITANGATLWSVGAQASTELTLVRVRGSLGYWLETVTTIGDGFLNVAHGICVVSENAAGIGVTAVPHPLADIGWGGWLWHETTGPVIGLSVTESENTGEISQGRIQIDSKAMRKNKATDFIIGVTEVQLEVGAATFQFMADTRVLDLLP